MRTPAPPGTEFDDHDVSPRTDLTPPTPLRARGTMPPPRGRRLNTLDDVIETGEIVERRSLVVRSSSVPAVDWNDEPTEITVPLPPIRPTRRWRSLFLLGAIVCDVLVVVLMLRPNPVTAETSALETRAELIGTTLDGEAHAALLRAEAIAASPVLRAGLSTDARTLADMAHDNDLVLPLEHGDVVELFQIRDGKRTLLLRLPAGANALAAPSGAATRIESRNHAVGVVAKAAVPTQRSGVAGEVVLSTPVDLAPVAKRISEHTSGAVLEGLDEPIVLIEGRSTPNVRIPITTKSQVAGSMSLAAVVHRTRSQTIAWGFLALSIVLLSMFAVSLVRERRMQAA